MTTSDNYAICTHSTPGAYIVFSCEQSSAEAFNNAAATGFCEHFLTKHKIGFQKIVGSYKGTIEQSFIINANDFKLITHLLRDNQQETYLYLTNHKHGLRKAYLVPSEKPLREAESVRHFLGYLRSVSKEEALKQDAWSFRPDLDQFWIVTESDKTN